MKEGNQINSKSMYSDKIESNIHPEVLKIQCDWKHQT